MPHVTSAKWDRTLVLNIPIFISIWIGLRAALEIHFCLIIRHRVLGYRLNTYHLEVTGYSDDPWWREFYIDFELSRLQFGSCPIGPTGDGPPGRGGDEPPPHGEHADHLPDPEEGRPPTPPWQPSSSSNTDNIHVIINQNRCTAEPVPPPRYYVSQHLNLLGANPTIASSSRCLEEILAHDETSRMESEVGGEQIQTPENHEVPDELDNNDLPPLPMALRWQPAQAQEPHDWAGHLVPPPGHHVVHAPPQPKNPIQRTYSDWQEYFDELHNRSNPNWGNNPMGPIVENSNPGTSDEYLTLPETGAQAEANPSRAEADTEEVADPLQDELNSPAEETEGYSIDPWPEVDQALEEAFNRQYKD